MALNTSEVAVIDIQGMTCQHCVQRIAEALRATGGVQKAEVNLDKNEAQVTYDPNQISIAKLMQTVNQAGYEATGFTRGPA